MTPAPMIGGAYISGLPNLLFVHETPRGYMGMDSPPFCNNVVEALRIADSYLARQ
jgi:hypothetical protein